MTLSVPIKTVYGLVILIIVSFGCKQQQHTPDTPDTPETPEMQQAVLAYEIPSRLGEGAIWNHESQELFWVDIEGKKLHIYDPKTGENRTLNTPSRVGTVVPVDANEAIIALDACHTMKIFCSCR